MDPQGPEHLDPELDALLRSRRPVPDPGWVQATERRLLGRGPRRAWRPAPALRLATALAVAIAALLVALSLAGTGPLAGNDQPVSAKDNCRTVAVTRTERVPSVVTVKGKPQITYHLEPVRRLQRVCR